MVPRVIPQLSGMSKVLSSVVGAWDVGTHCVRLGRHKRDVDKCCFKDGIVRMVDTWGRRGYGGLSLSLSLVVFFFLTGYFVLQAPSFRYWLLRVRAGPWQGGITRTHAEHKAIKTNGS